MLVILFCSFLKFCPVCSPGSNGSSGIGVKFREDSCRLNDNDPCITLTELSGGFLANFLSSATTQHAAHKMGEVVK